MTVLCYKAFVMLKVHYVGASGSLQPHPPKKRAVDKKGSKKLRVISAGGEKQTSSSKLYALYKLTSHLDPILLSELP